jgi:UDP-N-acetylglucosamine 2-epimerase
MQASKLKVLTLVGTRPEIIKLSAVIKRLDQDCHHILVHSGQNYDFELNQVFFNDLGLRSPDYFLNSAGKNACETIANVLLKADAVLESESPDAFLILGDTNSCYAAIAAKRRKIPIFHMEAGNRCFDQRVPEEINRKVIDSLSDINLVYTEHARNYLLQEGFRAEMVIKTGSPMREVLETHSAGIASSQVLNSLDLKEKRYFVLSMHREENVDNPTTLRSILSSVADVARSYGVKVVFSVHPRTQSRIEQAQIELPNFFVIMKPLGFFDYIKLQQSSLCVISDSGTLTEESSLLKFPSVMLREAHERPEGMDVGASILAGSSFRSISNAVNIAISQRAFQSHDVKDYESTNVSTKVVRIIASYWHFVKREVWKQLDPR